MSPKLPAAFQLLAWVVLALLTWTHDAAGNVLGQSESWPGDPARAAGSRVTTMAYDEANRLLTETVIAPGQPVTATAYSYDEADNRIAKSVSQGGTVQTATEYSYNSANQLVSWTEHDGDDEVLRSAALAYDNRGNRSAQTITLADTTEQATSYQWDFQNRLVAVTLPDATDHTYAYDYRTRRISRAEPAGATAVSWSGGLSLAEYAVSGLQGTVANALAPTVEYRRGPDMGGGIGGLLHSLRGGAAKYNLGNGRDDVVAQSDQSGALTWTASYEAFGKRPVETGSNADRQRANTKEEDPTGLLWEHFRYRDLERGVWLSRDPAGFVDGPNLYAYVNQNPWTKFDPLGLAPGIPSVDQGGNVSWNMNTPCRVCHGFGPNGYRGHPEQFKGLPGGPNAREGYAIAGKVARDVTIGVGIVLTVTAATGGTLTGPALAAMAGEEVVSATTGLPVSPRDLAEVVGKKALKEGAELLGETARKNAKEMATELSQDLGGKKSVPYVRSGETSQKSGHIDLEDTRAPHFDKESGKRISAPTVQERDIHRGPQGQINLGKETTRPATKQDIRTARTLSEKRGDVKK